MKIYSFITTDSGKVKTQGAHRFMRCDLRVGSAADSQQIADIELRATENEQGTILYSLTVDGVQVANGEQPKDSRAIVRGIEEVLAIGRRGRTCANGKHDPDNYGKCCDCGAWVGRPE